MRLERRGWWQALLLRCARGLAPGPLRVGAMLPRKAAVQDRLVRLRPVHAAAEGRWGGSATYLSRAASRSVASPLAHFLKFPTQST